MATDFPAQGAGHWFEALADHLGSAYLRYSFTKGTEQEADFLVEALGLSSGDSVLDVGCGPGRHAHALARRGMSVHGVDIAEEFIRLAVKDAPERATFERLDARALPYESEFDAVISLCQGAFGLAGHLGPEAGGVRPADAATPMADPDGVILEGMARALRPGGRLAVSAFSAYYQVRWLDHPESFDAASGVNHEITTIKDPEGTDQEVDLWTSCFTPRELRLLSHRAGLSVDDVWSVRPGEYGPHPPDVEHEEFLLIATRPPANPPLRPPGNH